MSNMTFALIADFAVKAIYAVCVTRAAIFFDKPSILWWYLLLLIIGVSYQEHRKSEKEE